MMKQTNAKQVDLVPLWKAMADSKRRHIIRLLGEKARTTSEISAHFDVSRFAIMRHLKVLEQVGLITTRREGRQRWNSLNDDLFQQVQQTYLENGVDGEYRLNDILGFLVRQDGRRAEDPAIAEQAPIELTVSIRATKDRVYQALTDEVDAWWSYRVNDYSHVHFEPLVGGRFYEAFETGGGALYAIVTFLRPGEEIRLNGSMGLTDHGVISLVNLTLQPQQDDSTQLCLTHHFLGRLSEVTAETFSTSWEELLAVNLKSYIEQGIAYQSPL